MRRGMDRIYWSVLSMNYQTVKPKVIVIDSSALGAYHQLRKKIENFEIVQHIHAPMSEFNMPRLYNIAREHVETEYMATTGADFLFKKDFFEICEKHHSPKKMLLKECFNIGRMEVSISAVRDWIFPKGRLNAYIDKRGENLANGACQYATLEWFKKWPFDERMSGWGAVDNLQAERARHSGLEQHWIEESSILHQWHLQEKLESPKHMDKFQRNQRLFATHLLNLKNKRG